MALQAQHLHTCVWIALPCEEYLLHDGDPLHDAAATLLQVSYHDLLHAGWKAMPGPCTSQTNGGNATLAPFVSYYNACFTTHEVLRDGVLHDHSVFWSD